MLKKHRNEHQTWQKPFCEYLAIIHPTHFSRNLNLKIIIRYDDPENVIEKKLGEPVKAYEYWRECQTLDQLEAIKNNPNAIHMEGLAIRERILGKKV